MFMAKYERSRGKKEFKARSPKRNTRGRSSFKDRPTGRDFKSNNRGRRDVTMTRVKCDSCHADCEVPFLPTSNKPVYCSKCFGKRDNYNSNESSNKDLEIINVKLDKIMKALKIN